MARPLVVVAIIVSVIGLAHGYCGVPRVEHSIDENNVVTAYCPLEDGTVKQDGESWVDETNCLKCTCGGQCCAFGFAMVNVMGVMKDGERCKAVKTGAGCLDFTFVKESDPSVDCMEPSAGPPAPQ